MPKYRVSLGREYVIVESTDLEIQATTPEEAEQLALAAVDENTHWREIDSDITEQPHVLNSYVCE